LNRGAPKAFPLFILKVNYRICFVELLGKGGFTAEGEAYKASGQGCGGGHFKAYFENKIEQAHTLEQEAKNELRFR
jgi:hypothetical protein